MPRTRTILLILILLFIAGYTGGFWGGAWYFSTGNTYFHFVGGLFMALLAASYYRSEFAKLSQPFRFFCLLALVMAVGVFWEFHEYALGHLLNASFKFQGDLADTMSDLLMDTLGGVVAGLYLFGRGNTK